MTDRPRSTLRPPLEWSRRHQKILELISDGYTNKEIGRAIYLGEDTVKTHVRRLYAFLGARDRAHAVRRGFELGFLRSAGVEEMIQREVRQAVASVLLEERSRVRDRVGVRGE